MKTKAVLWLTLLILSGFSPVTARLLSGTPATSAASSVVQRTLKASPPTTSLVVFNLRDFGAVGDGVTDDGPALQNALNALGEAGGGTLFVPAGRFAIVTPVTKDFTGLASEITIEGVESLTPVPPPNATGEELTAGLNLVSEFAPRTGAQGIAVNISGLQTFLLKHITFIGTPEVETDAFVTLALSDIWEATIRHCEFYGLSSYVEGGAIVLANRSHFTLEQSVFLGSTGNSAVYNSVVQNVEWKSIAIVDSVFMDYGQRPELFGKLGESTPSSWVSIGNAAAPENNSPRREAVITNVFFDEGAIFGLSSLPYQFQPPSAPIDLIYVSGLHMNVSNLEASGNYFEDSRRVLIENSHYGWSLSADSAINLFNVGNAILDRVECVDSANRIRADAATAKLTVIDSVYTFLDSQSPDTQVITPETPEDDPVQYVRQQFNTLLDRAPDAAAHFYWSDRLLQCGADAQCVTQQRAALNAYLNTTPLAEFSISGTVTDEAGAPLSGVVVTLSGSQSVATETGVDGKYVFAKLPTSGGYTVTPNYLNYPFDVPSQTIITPAGDQLADFVAFSQSMLEFGAASYSALEDARRITVTVTRTRNQSSAAEVTYRAIDGSAQQSSDVIPIIGRLRFAPNEPSASFVIFITNDSYVEGDESLMLELSDLAGATLGNKSKATLTIIDNDINEDAANPIDGARFFVRQHYRDFLNRQADAEGLDFWADQISACGTDAACIADRRMNVSAAFFLSIEFQQTGFLVYRLYQASYAQPPQHLDEFLLDTRTIGQDVVVNAPGWEELLDANKTALLETFVGRPRFTEAYPLGLTPAEFVNQLNSTAGSALSPDEIALLIDEFGGAATSEAAAARARVLRRVAESEDFSRRQLNPAFVMMQYFGYLQRNPYDAPDTNLDGYYFWLGKLEEFGGDFRRAEMVKSFLVSGEYRARFGPP